MRKVVGIDADVRRIAYGVFGWDAVLSAWRVTAVSSIERSNGRGRREVDYGWKLARLVSQCRDSGAVIWCEDIYLAGGKDPRSVLTYKALAKVQGELEKETAERGVPFYLVSANAWRATVLEETHNRDLLKQLAQAKATEWGHGEVSEHEADALCVAWYGVLQELEGEGSI